MGKRKLKEYEVHVPVREVWVFRVLAHNKKEARCAAETGEAEYGCVEQVYSYSGTKALVIKKNDNPKIPSDW